MSTTKPRALPAYIDILFDAASDAVSSARGDCGIDALDSNACILLVCVELQQAVIAQLCSETQALRAEVASLDRVLASRTDGLV